MFRVQGSGPEVLNLNLTAVLLFTASARAALRPHVRKGQDLGRNEEVSHKPRGVSEHTTSVQRTDVNLSDCIYIYIYICVLVLPAKKRYELEHTHIFFYVYRDGYWYGYGYGCRYSKERKCMGSAYLPVLNQFSLLGYLGILTSKAPRMYVNPKSKYKHAYTYIHTYIHTYMHTYKPCQSKGAHANPKP